jgi:phage terminase large subunit-like protein
VTVNFYDTEDKLIYKLQDSVSKIDPNMPCYIHIDMGYVSDLCGFSLIQFRDWVYFDDDRKTKMPSFTAPICVGISRLAGQETSVLHIYDLIMELSKKYEIASVSYDSHQTRPIAQELTRAGIDNRYVSVDRTTEPYIVLKNLLGRKLIELPDNDILQRELVELKYEGSNKIDHPVGGSKDISDSLCGAIYNAYINIDMASEPSQKTFNVKSQIKLLDMASADYNPTKEFINDRLFNIFR